MKRIAELRKKYGLSQRELGELIGAAQNTVCNWENGKRDPDTETLNKIAKAFNVSTDYLLGFDKKPSPLKADDARLIKKYHRLSDANKQVVLNLVDSLLAAQD